MAIRKPQPTHRHRPDSAPVEEALVWPYSISELKVRVRPNGTIVIPATFARLFAPEAGDEVTLQVMSDGHLEADTQHGRGPAKTRSSGKYYTSEEFLKHLEDVDAELKPK